MKAPQYNARFALVLLAVAAAAGLAFVLPGAGTLAVPGVIERFISHLLERPAGPLSLRFFLQPTMAALAAWKDGAADARTGRSPYFWTVLARPDERRARLREGFRATGKILGMGLLLDVAYQVLSYGRVYPLEAVAMALVLAFVPYLLLRGPVARIVSRRLARSGSNLDRAGDERS